MTLCYKHMDSPVGRLKLVASEHALVAVLWERERKNRGKLGAMTRAPAHAMLMLATNQLEEYFAARRTEFELPLAPRGSEFQQRVWQALRRIPFGATRSYLELAREIGAPKSVRAVGAANGRNPLAIVVPCHRVIGSNGALTGFAGGLTVKAKLLDFEAGRAAWAGLQKSLL